MIISLAAIGKTPISDRSFGEASKVPYGSLIKNEVTEYNGKVISVPLENGEFFKFNVDNMGDIAGIIGMFSAEDAGRIMNAIEQYKFTQSKLNEMEVEAFKAVSGRSATQ